MGGRRGSPRPLQMALPATAHLAMTNRPWIWRWVSREIKRNEKEKEMEGKKNEGACGSGCSEGAKT